MNKFMMNMYAKFLNVKQDFLQNEDGLAVVEIVVLIGIAIALAVLFRGRIESLLNELMDVLSGKAGQAIQ